MEKGFNDAISDACFFFHCYLLQARGTEANTLYEMDRATQVMSSYKSSFLIYNYTRSLNIFLFQEVINAIVEARSEEAWTGFLSANTCQPYPF